MTSKVDRLVSMVNQISLNLASNGTEDEVSILVAEHLQKFWSPPMKAVITEHNPVDTELSAISVKAVSRLVMDDTSGN
ncbi:formate dehydrogenase subunit delta [Porticoccaceae bacterium]|jgi:formate dehydrogenase subunit delta|nr:formate dehydrogenase subunit delta [Porticoccaceae bacterium]MDC0494673.1 formate dehydrogenase subunit delta [bacterium]MDA8651409.1 formate dehydrogenase subunit delta [Porticoccaceae bacterium]MDA8663356.1 formate dehydrogenase subunit delta [Porticoccaceae bacterium]MDA8682212.1 formate dehydrogenase subunit delta [Porticoccaceae bacterium]